MPWPFSPLSCWWWETQPKLGCVFSSGWKWDADPWTLVLCFSWRDEWISLVSMLRRPTCLYRTSLSQFSSWIRSLVLYLQWIMINTQEFGKCMRVHQKWPVQLLLHFEHPSCRASASTRPHWTELNWAELHHLPQDKLHFTAMGMGF